MSCTNADIVGIAVRIAALSDQAAKHRRLASLAILPMDRQDQEQLASRCDDVICSACGEMRRVIAGVSV